MASGLPSAGRSTRPIICRKRPIFLVGRARMQQPTSGMSQPSVSTMQLVTSSISPRAEPRQDGVALILGRRAVEVLGAHAGPDEFVADVDRMRDVDGERDGLPALAELVPMRDDVADQLGRSMRSASWLST